MLASSKEKTFADRIAQNQGILHKVCRMYTRQEADREDLLQEILLQVWKSLPHFEGRSKFSTWLYRIALNTAITYMRKDQRHSSRMQFPEVLPSLSSKSSEERDPQTERLYWAIGRLPKVEKALVMLYIDDYSNIEIGEMMGISPNNVAVRLHRIKTKLKNLLTEGDESR